MGIWGHSQASAGHVSASDCASKGFWDFYRPRFLFFLFFFIIYCNWVIDFTNVQNLGKERCHSLCSSFLSAVCLRKKILCPGHQPHAGAWRRFALASLLPGDSSVSLVSGRDLVGKDPERHLRKEAVHSINVGFPRNWKSLSPLCSDPRPFQQQKLPRTSVVGTTGVLSSYIKLYDHS